MPIDELAGDDPAAAAPANGQIVAAKPLPDNCLDDEGYVDTDDFMRRWPAHGFFWLPRKEFAKKFAHGVECRICKVNYEGASLTSAYRLKGHVRRSTVHQAKVAQYALPLNAAELALSQLQLPAAKVICDGYHSSLDTDPPVYAARFSLCVATFLVIPFVSTMAALC